MKRLYISYILPALIAGLLLTACNHAAPAGEPGTEAPAAITGDSNSVNPTDNTRTQMDTGMGPKSTLAEKVNKAIADSQKPLRLIITNLASKTAPVILSLYNMQNKFLDEKDMLKHLVLTPNGETLTAEIDDLQYGQFAIATYQDVNSDGKINQNMIGIPTEPYAFSNNYKPVIRAPKFNDCKFDYDESSNTVTISMIR